MSHLLVLAVLCMSLCACGGSTVNQSSTQTTTSKLADYQGIYVGNTEYSGGQNTGGALQVILYVDESGTISSSYLDRSAAQILSATRLNSSGQPQGNTTLMSQTGAPIFISYTGTIDLSREGAIDFTCTYSGAISGSIRFFGTRPQIAVHASTSASTIHLGEVVYLTNYSVMPGSKYPLGDGGILNPDQYYFWSFQSAPAGSVATINAGDMKYNYDTSFTPDMKGTYIITLTGHNGTGTPSSADVTINVI